MADFVCQTSNMYTTPGELGGWVHQRKPWKPPVQRAFPHEFVGKGPTSLLVRMGERQGIAQKGVRAIDPRKTAALNGQNAAKASVRAPGLSAD